MRGRSGRAARVVEDGGVDDVDRLAGGVRDDLVEDLGELDLVFVAGHVADVRRADNVGERQQRIVRVYEGFLVVDVDGGHARAPVAQRLYQCAGCHETRPARVDEQRGRLHPFKVGRGD